MKAPDGEHLGSAGAVALLHAFLLRANALAHPGGVPVPVHPFFTAFLQVFLAILSVMPLHVAIHVVFLARIALLQSLGHFAVAGDAMRPAPSASTASAATPFEIIRHASLSWSGLDAPLRK
jgi:hypothetical protein